MTISRSSLPTRRAQRVKKPTVRLSDDEGQRWPVAKVLHAGPAAYSDLAITPEMTICCLYECGEGHPYERLPVGVFTLAWLSDGENRSNT